METKERFMKKEIEEALKIISNVTGIEEKSIKIRELWFARDMLTRAQFKIHGYDYTFNVVLDNVTLHYLHDVPQQRVLK